MTFKHILVPIDGSETANLAFEKATELARTFNSQITFVQVMTLDPYIADEYIKTGKTNEMIERARHFILNTLQEAQNKVATYGLETQTLLLEGQSVHTEILKVAEQLNIDLIVIGSHGRTGLKKLLLGSVAQTLLSSSEIPVLVVRK